MPGTARLLEAHRVRYVLAIPKSEVLPLPDGRTRQTRELWAVVGRAGTTGPPSNAPPPQTTSSATC